MTEQLILFEISEFKEWIKNQFGYTIGNGIWEHSLPYICKLVLLQKWLREDKKLNIEIGMQYKTWWYSINKLPYDSLSNEDDIKGGANFKMYEEALKEGLKETLKLKCI